MRRYWNKLTGIEPWGKSDGGVGQAVDNMAEDGDMGKGRSSGSENGTRTLGDSSCRKVRTAVGPRCIPQDRGYQPYRLDLVSRTANLEPLEVANVPMVSAAKEHSETVDDDQERRGRRNCRIPTGLLSTHSGATGADDTEGLRRTLDEQLKINTLLMVQIADLQQRMQRLDCKEVPSGAKSILEKPSRTAFGHVGILENDGVWFLGGGINYDNENCMNEKFDSRVRPGSGANEDRLVGLRAKGEKIMLQIYASEGFGRHVNSNAGSDIGAGEVISGINSFRASNKEVIDAGYF